MHGALVTIVSLGIYGLVVPRTNYAIRHMRGEIIFASNLAADLKPRVFYTHLPEDAVLFVDEIRPGGQRRLEGVLAILPQQSGSTELMLARYGDIYPADDGSGALLLDLYQYVGHYFNSDNPETYKLASGYSLLRSKRLDPAPYLKDVLEPPDRVVTDFSPAELWREYRVSRAELHRLQEQTGPTDTFMAERRARLAAIELHQRVALPLASLFLAILALPLGITRVHSGKGAGFAMSLVVLLVYWVAFTMARNQSVSGTIPAALGPWAGNLIIVPWAAIALWRLRWRSQHIGGHAVTVGSQRFDLGRWIAPLRRLRKRMTPDRETEALAGLGLGTSRFVGRLDQYLGAHYLRILVFSLASAYLIYALVESRNLTEGALRSHQPMSLMLVYFQYFWPGVLHVVLPISCLVGAIVAFTLISRTGELLAIKASGVSLRRATLPVLVLTVLLCGLLFLVQDRLAPGANRKAKEVRDQIMGRAPRTYGLPVTGSWSFGPGGQRLYHYRLYDPVTKVFQGLSVFTLDRSVPRLVDHRFSKRARWNGETWELEQGWFRTFPIDGSAPVYEMHEDTLHLALDPPGDFANTEVGLAGRSDLPEQLSLKELRREIRALSSRGYDITQLRVAYNGKLAQALSPLVMVLLGLPFAFKVGARGSLYAIGVAFLLVLVYWATFAVFNALGLETLVPPYVAAWAPNALFGLFGIYLMLFVKT
jgi:LPS export ABC transporter permease LptG